MDRDRRVAGPLPPRGSRAAGPAAAGEDAAHQAQPEDLPLLPGFREMAMRAMSAARQRLVADLVARRQTSGLSQTQVAALMGTSQSAVARLESGAADVRASTLERYAAAIGSQIGWQLLAARPERDEQRKEL